MDSMDNRTSALRVLAATQAGRQGTNAQPSPDATLANNAYQFLLHTGGVPENLMDYYDPNQSFSGYSPEQMNAFIPALSNMMTSGTPASSTGGTSTSFAPIFPNSSTTPSGSPGTVNTGC